MLLHLDLTRSKGCGRRGDPMDEASSPSTCKIKSRRQRGIGASSFMNARAACSLLLHGGVIPFACLFARSRRVDARK